mmetsp:Transcript_23068/g.34955  ORF Transcript_23068/g.34955 Transcript_23068/m.34955 type:complete len:602 (-) Transcript_23068:221-2026(-)
MVDKIDSRTEETDRRNLNSHYGNFIGFLQTLSLILNAGLMVYAHIGLAGVVYSSQPTIAELSGALASDNYADSIPDENNGNSTESLTDHNTTFACDVADLQVWIDNGGKEKLGDLSNYCSVTSSCFLTSDCNSQCFQEYGFSASCASACFPSNIQCGFSNCLNQCFPDANGEECRSCAEENCDSAFYNCTGFPEGSTDNIGHNETTNTTDQNESITDNNNVVAANPASCNYNLEVSKWYVVYNMTFIGSVRDAWEADVKILSVIIVLFSGIWPYAKNLILMLAWYVPMSHRMRSRILLWLTRLSKYTLVDVFAVIVILVATQLNLTVDSVEALTRSEARFGIVAFLIATVWEFIQIEWAVVKHNRITLDFPKKNSDESQEHEGMPNKGTFLSMLPTTALVLFILTLGCFIAGSILDLFRIEIGRGESACINTYNIINLCSSLISEFGLRNNTTEGQTWILYISYLFFVLILPIATHVLQITLLHFLMKHDRGTKMKNLVRDLTKVIWGMSCVDVFLIGLFAVEYKFADFVKALSPSEEDASLVVVESDLGPGFFVLIGYSVLSGLFQYCLQFQLFHDEQALAKTEKRPSDVEDVLEVDYDA